MLNKLKLFALVTYCLTCAVTSNAAASEPTVGEVTALPMPALYGKMSLEGALLRRRSVRSFGETPLSLRELGQLLWSAQGITNKIHGYRTAPSAGALYPLELYVATSHGVYKYLPDQHAIRVVKTEDVRAELGKAALDQEWVSQAPASIVITAVFSRTSKKYGRRADNYVPIEVGCAGQNILLQATSLGIGSVPVGAFKDRKVRSVIGAAKDERPMLIISLGRTAQ